MLKEFGAFGNGIEAAKQGLPESSNPYNETDTEYSQWVFGYEIESTSQRIKNNLTECKTCA